MLAPTVIDTTTPYSGNPFNVPSCHSVELAGFEADACGVGACPDNLLHPTRSVHKAQAPGVAPPVPLSAADIAPPRRSDVTGGTTVRPLIVSQPRVAAALSRRTDHLERYGHVGGMSR